MMDSGPDPQHQHGTIFTRGQEVEVTCDEEGFKGAWYSCTILEPGTATPTSKRRKKALVQYKSLLCKNRRGLLKEHVDPCNFRPPYPSCMSGDGVFEVDDVVEADYKDGWWIGVVRKALEGPRYRVYFDSPPDVIDFDGNQLRLHLKWVDGNWVRAEKVQRTVGSHFSSGADVEVSLDEVDERDTWYRAVVLKENGDGTFLVKFETLENDVKFEKAFVDCEHIRPIPPYCQEREYQLLEKVDACGDNVDFCWQAGVITKLLAGGKYTVFFKKSNSDTELDWSRLRPHVEWIDGKWICDSKEVLMVSDNQEQPKSCNLEMAVKPESSGAANINSKRKSSTIRNVMGQQSNSDEKSASGYLLLGMEKRKVIDSNCNVMHGCTSKMLAGDAIVDPLSTTTLKLYHVPIETPINETLHGLTTPKPAARRSKPVARSSRGSTKSLCHYRRGAKTQNLSSGQNIDSELHKFVGNSQRRKRGRPRKFIDLKSPEAAREDNFTGHASNEVAVKNHTSDEVQLPALSGVDSKAPQNTSRRKISRASDEYIMTEKVDMAVAKAKASKDVADEDKPLSTWFGGHSLTGLHYARPTNGCNEAREKELVALESHAIGVRDNSTLDANLCLPFVKKSQVWQTIESIEVFQLVPQNPHFRPLAECKEEFREGTAIGIMVTFASLFEKISSMQFDDSRSTYESALESLQELEKHGFDVTLPQQRVNDLLSIRDGQAESLNVSRDADKQMRNLVEEKRNCNEKLCAVEKKIAELQEELALCKANMEAKNLEISTLQVHINGVNGQINNARQDYVKVATAPWKLP